MKTLGFEDLSESDKALVISARDVAQNAYAPYSGFAVGCAIRTKSGKVVTSANMENASYGVTICAEAGALSAATSLGELSAIQAIAIVGFIYSPIRIATQVVTPCGRCRQLIFEAAELADHDIDVFCCNGDLTQIELYGIFELLPRSFGPNTVNQTGKAKSTEEKPVQKKLKVLRT
jgi:cytidine deaminase